MLTPELLAVEIETFSACNRACSYCPNAEHRRPTRGYMSVALYRKIIGDLADMDFHGRLSFHFYNEPLLDRRLSEFVRYARARLPGIYVKIFTNGDRLTVDRFRELREAGVDRFWVTRHEGRMNAVAQMVDALAPEERSAIRLQSFTDLTLSNRGGLLPLVRQPAAARTTPCALPSARMVITLGGNVVLCAEDYHERVVLGNVAECSVGAIWRDGRLQAIRERLWAGDRSCTSICNGCSNTSYGPVAHEAKVAEHRSMEVPR